MKVDFLAQTFIRLELNFIISNQARECLFEKNELGLYEEDENNEKKKGDIDKYLAVGQEAAYVSTT